MPLWLQAAIPLGVGAAVFAAGAVLDGRDFTPDNWWGFLGLGVVLPGALVAIVVGVPLGFCLYAVEEVKRAYLPGRSIRWACGQAVANFGGVKVLLAYLAGGLFVEAVLWTCVVLLVQNQHFHRGGLYLPSLWLLAALAATAATAATAVGVLGWVGRRSPWGRWLLLAPPAAIIVAVLVGDYWARVREESRYEWVDYNAAVDDDSDEDRSRARPWADRLIELRPGDPRGYVRRVRTYRLGDRQQLLDDIEAAVRLGCNRFSDRRHFARTYARLGLFDRSLAEYETALAFAAVHRDTTGKKTGCEWEMQWVKLHAGRYGEVIRWCSATVGSPPAEGDVSLLDLAALAHIGRGDYSAAERALLSLPRSGPDVEVTRLDLTRAWLLATCPDPQARDGRKAVELARRYVDVVNDLSLKNPRYEGMFRWLTSDLDRLYGECLADAHRVLAAALLEVGQVDEARTAFDRWTFYVVRNEWLLVNEKTFWGVRFRQLEECVRKGQPYREGSGR